MLDQGTTQGRALKTPAVQLQDALQQIMRRFGRPCRGQGRVCVKLVRETDKQWRDLGQQVGPLAVAAQRVLQEATPWPARQHARLTTQLTTAREAPALLVHQSRRLTHGPALPQGTMVNPDDRTMAPIGQGKSNGPTPCGRQPGMSAAPASGFIFAAPLPVGPPSAQRSVLPLVDTVQQAITQVAHRPQPALHSLAGDLALNDTALREVLHARGMLTVGIPRTGTPIPPTPTQEEVRRMLHEAGVSRQRTPHQVHLAWACGYRRPVVASLLTSLLCRGAERLRYQGHRGALLPLGMTVMAHNAATVVRIEPHRLSKRAQKLRRILCLRTSNSNQYNASNN